MENNWDSRYRIENKIWGELPSQTTRRALESFRQNGVKKLLVPGSGYGRNTRFFSSAGFDVTSVEISAVACELAREFDPLSKCHCASVLDLSFLTDTFDAVYCFNTLQIFCKKEREICIGQCLEKVNAGGLMYFTAFSESETGYGKGKQGEENTFESKPGRPVHYFTEGDLKAHFTATDIIKTGITEEFENHGDEGTHTHLLRYILVRKAGKDRYDRC